MNNCTEQLAPVIERLSDGFTIEKKKEHCQIITPFRHWNDDLITIYIRKARGTEYYVLRDYGQTHSMLKMYGVNLDNETRQKHIESINERFNLKDVENEIQLESSESGLEYRILDLIQAMQSYSYLMYTFNPQPPQYNFKNVVSSQLTEWGYRPEEDYTVHGETEERKFDISINHRSPRVLMDTIHSSSTQYLKQQRETAKLNWHEIKNLDFQHAIVVDNEEGYYDESIFSQLRDSVDYYFEWDQRNEIKNQIAVK